MVICGWSASCSPTIRAHQGVDHAHTAVASTTSQIIVPPILFVALDTMLLLPLNLNQQYPLSATHPTQPLALPSSHHHIRQHNLCAGISTSTGVHAYVPTPASATHATGVAPHHMGSGTVIDRPPTPLPIDQHQMISSLRLLELELERELTHHPDKGFVCQLIHDIVHGCNIGYNGPQFAHTAHHLPSALEHPHIISETLAKECAAGRMAGSFPISPLPNLRCSGLGVVPEKEVDSGSYITSQLHPAEASATSLIPSNILSDIALLTQPLPSSTHLVHTP